jgi:Beta-glucosidase-related glycosidases
MKKVFLVYRLVDKLNSEINESALKNGGEKMKKKKKQASTLGKVIKTVLSAIATIFLAILIFAANVILPSNAKMVNNMVDLVGIKGFSKSIDNSKLDVSKLNLDYNVPDYTSDSIKKHEDLLSQQIFEEGTVLLKNDNQVMPYAKGTEFSFFGINSREQAPTLMTSVIGGQAASYKETFEKSGFKVNDKLWDFYNSKENKEFGLGPGSISYGDGEDFSINELPLNKLKKQDDVLKSTQGTVPVFVIKRVAGEGRDMPRSMYNHTDIKTDKEKSYIEPNSVELEVLKYLNDNFSDVSVIVNSNAALELDWLKDFPNIHSVLFAPTIGEDIGKIYSGEINPSGRTVDTFAANPEQSPAAQNTGDYQYYDEDGKPTKFNYVSYKEGIYVGYKYYETRYEDTVLKQGNPGEYDYNKEVVYPFGYGLSYTNFEWDNYKTEWEKDNGIVTVDVKNTGDYAGKDVVEIFAQSPYTEYDKENGVEKSSVELVGYAKTSLLQPGATETVTVEINEEQLKSYDANKAKTYILDAGKYYIAAGRNAHDALNNILNAKKHTVDEGMTHVGNNKLVSVYVPKNNTVDTEKYKFDSRTNQVISNQFDDAKGDVKYLTRNDWTGTFPTPDGEASDTISTWGNEINGTDKDGNPTSYTRFKVASKELLDQLESTDSHTSVDKEKIKENIVYSSKNDVTLIDMRGLKFDDPKWNELLDNLEPADYQTLIVNSGYGIEKIDSINKPFNQDADTSSGLIYGGTGKIYPNMIVLAQTWNQELALDYGKMIGNEALLGGADGWYAPSMNIHRTPFSGRNGEYYSEDGFLSGTVGKNAVYGASSKGMYTYIKHFVLNDQENHRGDRTGQFGLATWANEQAIREIYLKPFEMSIKSGEVDLNYVKKDDGGNFVNATTKIPVSMAVMSSFNRIGATWTGGSYPLISGVLRNEWGFNGFVITDNANTGVFMDDYQMIEAGGDAKLLNSADPTGFEFDENNVAQYHYGRESIHRILYTIVNSKAMNGAMPGSVFKQGMTFTSKVRWGVNVVSIVLIALMVYMTVRRFRKDSKK